MRLQRVVVALTRIAHCNLSFIVSSCEKLKKNVNVENYHLKIMFILSLCANLIESEVQPVNIVFSFFSLSELEGLMDLKIVDIIVEPAACID